MRKPAETDNTPQDYESMNLTNAFESSGVTSTGTGTRDSLATTSMSETAASEKSNSRWTEHEVKLLLDYDEANCTLTTGRGLNLKKLEFSKARAMI